MSSCLHLKNVVQISLFCTCRWRDVKFHAFDNAKHRTYVDLKVSVSYKHLLPEHIMSCLVSYEIAASTILFY